MRLQVTERAITHYRRVRAAHCRSNAQAEAELAELLAGAAYKRTHANGRQLWRTGRPLQLRLVVEGMRVLWVGQGRPPDALWPREPTIEKTRAVLHESGLTRIVWEWVVRVPGQPDAYYLDEQKARQHFERALVTQKL